MTHRSGQYRINRREAESIRDEFSFAFAPRAKVLTAAPIAPVEPQNAQHAAFLDVYRQLISSGWTQRALARHLGLKHHRPLIDWREGNRAVSWQWIERMRAILTGADEQELPSGTWG
jgi:hypothetical protein